METKICTKCGVEYPATREFFHVLKSGKYGLASSCKDCYKKYSKKYYEKNAERIIESVKKYYEKNAERRIESIKKYREKNPEKIREYAKKCYEKNAEKIRERQKKYSKKYRENNPEKIREYNKKYNENNIEKMRERYKKYRENNHEKCIYKDTKRQLKKQIGAPPPPELVEIKVLINKTKELCKTLKN